MTGARARSPDEKRARRHFILTIAEQILRNDGFDAFTMNSLATTTGLAKGTLYLYFSSREELVLALYIHLNDDWVDRFLQAEKAYLPPDYAALCARFYQSFAADALLVDLAGRAASGLEPYVATPAKVMAKRAHARAARRISGLFYQNFDCDPAQAQRLAWAFLAALAVPSNAPLKCGTIVFCRKICENLVRSCRAKMFFSIWYCRWRRAVVKTRSVISSHDDAKTESSGRKARIGCQSFAAMGFLSFWLVSSAFYLTFPLSLGLCLLLVSRHRTTQLIRALVHDFLQTIFILVVVVVLIIWAVWHFLLPLFGG
jgi:AcrR family transcriptional regulator